jgi:hypothetical protein
MALALYRKMGYGDSATARARWERALHLFAALGTVEGDVVRDPCPQSTRQRASRPACLHHDGEGRGDDVADLP